jgi:hypothetical protein
MVFHKHRIIFTGIPKNASHAPFAHLSNKTDSGHHHASYMQDYREHDEELLDTYTSLAITRNPYDRAYSCWNFLKVIEDIEGRFGIKNFTEYVYALESRTAYYEEQNEELTQHELTYPQYKFITIKGRILVDHLLRFENLDEDWKTFTTEYNKTAQFKLKPTLIISNSMEYAERDWTKIYTPEMYSIINEFYKKDFELFNYEMRTK